MRWSIEGSYRLTVDYEFTLDVILTQEHQVAIILQHHIPVQSPLSRVQTFPLLCREINGHILE